MHPYFNPKEVSPVRYQCLVLDHDDTVVNSTASVNYPAFVQTLRTLRPDVHMTLDDFFSYSFEPGFGALCSDILHFSDSGWSARARTCRTPSPVCASCCSGIMPRAGTSAS